MGGEFCVTRVITGPTEDVRREFAELEERSLRYLTLGPGPKALAGNTQQLDARHQHALLAVANQRTLDQLMQIADAVGLQIESIEPSLIALSRAQAHLRDACKEACLIIQLDEDVAELGICHHGRLLLDYRPGGHTNAENVAGVVAQHLSRLQRYIERYHSYSGRAAPPRLPGRRCRRRRPRTAEVQRAAEFRSARARAGRHRHAVEARGRNAGHRPGRRAWHGHGAVLRVDRTAGPEPDRNAPCATHREPMRPILIRSLIAVRRRAARGRRTVLLFQLKQWREVAAVCSRARKPRPRVCPRHRAAAEARLPPSTSSPNCRPSTRQLPQPNWQQIFSRISQSMPDDVWLDRLAVRDGMSASLAGASYTDGGVYDFVGYLKQVPDIAEIALEGTGVGQSATGPTTNFTLQLTLANLAGRSEKESSP